MGNKLFNNMQEVYTYCKNRIFEKVYRQVRNKDAAEDITSDIFASIAAHAEWYIRQDAVRQKEYFVKVYKRTISGYLYRKKSEKTVEYKEAMLDGLLSKEDRLVFMEEDAVRNCFNNLTDTEKDTAERIYVKRESVRDIADKEKVSANTIYQRLSRANRKIRKNVRKNNNAE